MANDLRNINKSMHLQLKMLSCIKVSEIKSFIWSVGSLRGGFKKSSVLQFIQCEKCPIHCIFILFMFTATTVNLFSVQKHGNITNYTENRNDPFYLSRSLVCINIVGPLMWIQCSRVTLFCVADLIFHPKLWFIIIVSLHFYYKKINFVTLNKRGTL